MDGKNICLIFVEIVSQKGTGPPMYQLSSQTGVILRLYHLSYITSMAANPEILGLKTVVEKWTGQTKIGETKAVRADSLVGSRKLFRM